MKIGLRIKHHDHDYVEQRGGWELLMHLRGGRDRAKHRVRAIDKSAATYAAAIHAEDNAATKASGLVVLQRALLAAEDLGGALHALTEDDPWRALRRTSLDQIDAAFGAVEERARGTVQGAFRLPTQAMLDDAIDDPADRAAAQRLLTLTASRWAKMLDTSASLWLRHARTAKAIMHGFPMLDGDLIVGSPGAGEVGAKARWPHPPFAVAVMSARRERHVSTQRAVVELNESAVGVIACRGRVAARLYGDLCSNHAASIMAGYAAIGPLDLLECLGQEDQARMRRLAAAEEAPGAA